MRLVSYRDGGTAAGGILVDGGAAVVPLSALASGDIVATGTPAGIGSYQNVFLRHGDSVAVGVAGLGAVTNRVAAEARP